MRELLVQAAQKAEEIRRFAQLVELDAVARPSLLDNDHPFCKQVE
jgi:hypothetical protein